MNCKNQKVKLMAVSSQSCGRVLQSTVCDEKWPENKCWLVAPFQTTRAHGGILDCPIKIGGGLFDPPPYFVGHPPILLGSQKNFFRRFSLFCISASAAPSKTPSECVRTQKPPKNQFFGRFWVIFRSCSAKTEKIDRKMTQNRPKMVFRLFLSSYAFRRCFGSRCWSAKAK